MHRGNVINYFYATHQITSDTLVIFVGSCAHACRFPHVQYTLQHILPARRANYMALTETWRNSSPTRLTRRALRWCSRVCRVRTLRRAAHRRIRFWPCATSPVGGGRRSWNCGATWGPPADAWGECCAGDGRSMLSQRSAKNEKGTYKSR